MKEGQITFNPEDQAEKILWINTVLAAVRADNSIESAILWADDAVRAYRQRMPNA